MTRHSGFYIKRVVERFLILCINFFSECLREISSDVLETALNRLKTPKGTAAGGTLEIQYEPFKTKCVETSYQNGSSGIQCVTHGAVISLPDWAREISPFLANQLSDHTRRAYEKDMKQFLAFISSFMNAGQFLNLKAEHIILYRKALEEGRITGRSLAKTSINRKLAVIKSFMGWLKRNHIVRDNPAELVKGYPQTQDSSLLGLSDEEAKKILESTAWNSPSKALHCAVLHTLLYLGLRKSELIKLRVGDWDTERGVEVLRVMGKGHRVRVLPVTEKLQLVLSCYFRVTGRSRDYKDEPLFTPTKNPRRTGLVRHLSPHAITYIVLRYARRAGVMKKISPHSCRATCISNALDRRASQRSVQHLAGWSTPLMIQRYDKRREELSNSAAFTIDYGERVAAPL